MKMKTTAILLACCLIAYAEPAQSNFDKLVELSCDNLHHALFYLRNEGLPSSVFTQDVFIATINDFNTNWPAALSNMVATADNPTNLEVFIRCVGFMETNKFLTAWSDVMAISTNSPSVFTPNTVKEVAFACQTPLEDYIVMNFDVPAVSNRLLQMSLLFPTNSAERGSILDVANGILKERILDERTAVFDTPGR